MMDLVEPRDRRARQVGPVGHVGQVVARQQAVFEEEAAPLQFLEGLVPDAGQFAPLPEQRLPVLGGLGSHGHSLPIRPARVETELPPPRP
ncbi:hypothetical protein [Amycolatopsis sp. lyj-23]|uniref:hypothetical protein n=1 Tax=Amycolatopsis sp. lyj-23 TaxID=2789283 RepID=UPI00397A5F8D